MQTFPTGEAMNKNLMVRMGNCNRCRYMPMLVDLVRSGTLDPQQFGRLLADHAYAFFGLCRVRLTSLAALGNFCNFRDGYARCVAPRSTSTR
jgi:hypothetical protein